MQLLIASTSTVYGLPYLSYLKDAVHDLFNRRKKILFVPFARAGGLTWEAYTAKAAAVFADWDYDMRGAESFGSPEEGLNWAEGIFTGGGNTFLLLKTIYEQHWYNLLNETVRNGTPYMGTSAGSNLCGISIGTTNDMPIVWPPSLQAMGWVPFNINPHYLDPLPDSTHMGETREERIGEFHHFNAQPVIGLREGSYITVRNDSMVLGGPHTARLFQPEMPAIELEPGSLNF